MSASPPLTTLLPIRDARDRVLAFELRSHPGSLTDANDIDAEAHAVLGVLRPHDLLRLARPKPLHVPITPGVLRSGAITMLASQDVVYTLAADVLDDPDGRRALERFAADGFHFAFVLDGPEARLPVLSGALANSWAIFDATVIGGGLALANVVQRLLAAGARPIARHVDDRATRERLRVSGVAAFTGRALPRGRGASREARERAVGALALLGRLAEGRPIDAELDRFMADEPEFTDAVLRSIVVPAGGGGRPRSYSQAVMRLGREAMIDRFIIGTAFLLAESSGTPEVANTAIGRARMLQRLGTAIDDTGHTHAHVVAGLLSSAEPAVGYPAAVLAETLGLAAPSRDILLERQTPLGQLVDLVEAYEAGWWDDLLARAERLGLAPVVVSDGWRASQLEARAEVAEHIASDG